MAKVHIGYTTYTTEFNHAFVSPLCAMPTATRCTRLCGDTTVDRKAHLRTEASRKLELPSLLFQRAKSLANCFHRRRVPSMISIILIGIPLYKHLIRVDLCIGLLLEMCFLQCSYWIMILRKLLLNHYEHWYFQMTSIWFHYYNFKCFFFQKN